MIQQLDPDRTPRLSKLFARAGATMNITYELEHSLSMINFVAMGIGCSLLPDYARSIRQPGVVYKRLRSPTW